MKTSSLSLPFPLSLQSIKIFESDNNLELESLFKKIEQLNGGEPENYETVYYGIPPNHKDIREAFKQKIYKKARRENWLVRRFEEVMKRLD